jgi:hypothetical protein
MSLGNVNFSTNACIKSKLHPNITFELLVLQMQVNNNKKHNAHVPLWVC